MYKFKIFIFLFLFLPSSLSFSQESHLETWKQLQRKDSFKKELIQFVRQSVRQIYFPQIEKKSFHFDLIHSSPALPIFITVKKGEQVRACMGSLQVQTSNLQEEINQKLRLAFLQDIRYPPIRVEELSGLKIYLSVVGNLRPVKNAGELNPFRDGIYLRSGSKEALYLPGEAKTLAYALKQIRAKAGISEKDKIQIFKFMAESMEIVNE